MIYENLLNEAFNENIYVIESAQFESHADGLINGDVIGINKHVKSYRKKACILAEELGHYYTSTGNILDLKNINNRRQEHQARLWAYNKLLGLNGILKCHLAGCNSLYDMAEYLELTEEFIFEAIEYYKLKYGTYTTIDNYIIMFEPSLLVIEQ